MTTYLFDFDGTLVDSMPTFIKATLSILDKNYISYESDIVKIITPLGFLGTAEYFITLGVKGTADEIVTEMKENMKEAYFHHIPGKSNVIDTLQHLKANGADLNILTASPHVTLDACLKRLGIYELFTNVWSCEDFGTSKADPNIYKMAAERLGLPVSKVLFLDDNIDAVKTAKCAGMKVCGVFDDSSADYEDQIRDAADFYIHNFQELPELSF